MLSPLHALAVFSMALLQCAGTLVTSVALAGCNRGAVGFSAAVAKQHNWRGASWWGCLLHRRSCPSMSPACSPLPQQGPPSSSGGKSKNTMRRSRARGLTIFFHKIRSAASTYQQEGTASFAMPALPGNAQVALDTRQVRLRREDAQVRTPAAGT